MLIPLMTPTLIPPQKPLSTVILAAPRPAVIPSRTGLVFLGVTGHIGGAGKGAVTVSGGADERLGRGPAAVLIGAVRLSVGVDVWVVRKVSCCPWEPAAVPIGDARTLLDPSA